MGGKSKIVDESEVIRWLEEGRTFQWIVDEYRRKYSIETTLGMWGNLRRRRGLDRRSTRDVELIPWTTEPEHREDYDLAILRFEARRRAGLNPLSPTETRKLAQRIDYLDARDLVIDYTPEDGFMHVPRRPGVDDDMIRKPDPACTYLRRN